jgi:hypothetical protein
MNWIVVYTFWETTAELIEKSQSGRQEKHCINTVQTRAAKRRDELEAERRKYMEEEGKNKETSGEKDDGDSGQEEEWRFEVGRTPKEANSLISIRQDELIQAQKNDPSLQERFLELKPAGADSKNEEGFFLRNNVLVLKRKVKRNEEFSCNTRTV